MASPNPARSGGASDPARPLLQIRVLGGFSLHAETGYVALPTRKAQALLAFLACSPGREHARESLSTLLWGEHGRAQAQRSLRQALFSIRRALPPSALPALIADSGCLRLDAEAIEVDASLLEQAIQANTREALSGVAELYLGGLLEGFDIDEPSFEDWLSAERKRLYELVVSGLTRLAALQAECGELDRAIQSTLQLLRLEPWAESQHRSLMQLYVRHGRARSALEHYQQFADTMQRELGVAPEAETERLKRSILQELREPAAGAAYALHAGPASDLTASPLGKPLTREPSLSPFVGRARELDRLGQLLALAFAGAPTVLAVSGDAGVGKSRLLEELARLATARRATIVHGRCFESERVLPLAPWAELLREGSGLLDAASWDGLSAGQRVELSRLAPRGDHAQAEALPTAPPVDDILRLFTAVRSVFERTLRNGPVLLIVDDLQWADELSLRLISYVARRVPAPAALLLAVTVRREELADATFLVSTLAEIEREGRLARLALEPLSESETYALVDAQGSEGRGAPVDRAFALRIWSMSEGNPLVALEALRALSREGKSAELDARLPEGVREFIASRFKRQSPLAQELIGLAAAIGRGFEYALLERASGHARAEVLSAVEELISVRIFQPSREGFYFTHDRLREVAYSRLLPERRRSLHALVGRAIEELYGHALRDWYGRLAIHFRQANELRAAVRYLSLSADEATQKYGLVEAVSAMSAALELVEQLPEPERSEHHVELALRQAYCLFHLGRAKEIVPSLHAQRARLLALDRPALSSRVHFWLGLAHSLLGAHKIARAHASEATTLADCSGDLRTGGLARGLLAYEKFFSGEYEEGIRLGLESVQILTDLNDGPTQVAMAWLHIGMHRIVLGDHAGALEALACSEQLAEQGGATRIRSLAWSFRSLVHTCRGEPERALEVAKSALTMAPDPVSSMTAAIAITQAQVELGLYDEALATLNNLMALLKASNLVGPQGVALSISAAAELGKGNVELATSMSEDALRLLREADDPRAIAVALRVSSQCAAAGGHHERARQELREARAMFEAIRAAYDVAQTDLMAASLAISEGDASGARTALQLAAARFAELGLSVRAVRAAARAMPTELAREISAKRATPARFDGAL